MEVAESWAVIEHWISRNAVAEQLPSGASVVEMDELQEDMPVHIPQDLRSSLRRHNGTGETEIIPPAFTLWGTRRILSEYVSEPFQSERVYIPIGSMGPNVLSVDSRSDRLARYDSHYGFYAREEEVFSSSFGDILAAVATAISGSSSTLHVSPNEAWRATKGVGHAEGYLVREDS
ncbi:hypothetical protein [Streptomyces microflavus]|uniref:hypothetical protein n=1 Tax=Streptomyces microflavus TaxID=1919 RepID=UPI0033A657E9